MERTILRINYQSQAEDTETNTESFISDVCCTCINKF